MPPSYQMHGDVLCEHLGSKQWFPPESGKQSYTKLLPVSEAAGELSV